jgi:hypothetical protein
MAHPLDKETEPLKLTISTIAGAIAGAFLGTVLLNILTQGLDNQFRPKVTNNDWYGFVLFFIVPGGVLLGAATGIAFSFISYRKYRTAGFVCAIAGFICIAAILGLSWLPHRDVSIALKALKSALFSDSFVFWLLILWSSALLIWGIALQKKKLN